MFSSQIIPNDYVSYKKLVKTLNSNFAYDLQADLVGKHSLNDVVNFRADVQEQQALISESSYEYSNEKYRKNIIVLEALGHLVNLLEIRSYRIDAKTGALLNYATQADKVKSLNNPKDNRPDLNYFTQDHLNIEEPIKVGGNDDMDAAYCAVNSVNQQAPADNMKKAEVYVGVNDGNPNYSTPTNTALETELSGLSSGDVSNISDKVKADVKKEIVSDIADAFLLLKRKNEEQKLGESIIFNESKINENVFSSYDKNTNYWQVLGEDTGKCYGSFTEQLHSDKRVDVINFKRIQ